jgi:hypothetical protein
VQKLKWTVIAAAAAWRSRVHVMSSGRSSEWRRLHTIFICAPGGAGRVCVSAMERAARRRAARAGRRARADGHACRSGAS